MVQFYYKSFYYIISDRYEKIVQTIGYNLYEEESDNIHLKYQDNGDTLKVLMLYPSIV